MSRRARLARALAGVALALALAGAALAGAALAEEAPPDTLDEFLEEQADSTDLYFGESAAPLDTTDLDEVISDQILDEEDDPEYRFGILPYFSFNRVDAVTPGLSVSAAGPRRRGHTGLGRLSGRIAYANGPNDVLGGVAYDNRLWLLGRPVDLRIFGGRLTDRMNRDKGDSFLNTLRAFFLGSDRSHYLRHDGFEASLDHDAGAWRAAVGYRDVLESPMPVTATWNVFDRTPSLTWNLPAAFGRVHETELALGVRWPWVPVVTEVVHHSSSEALGSDFVYDRVRAAAGAEIALWGVAALVPQVVYGRLNGEMVPQSAFYLGGSRSVRSVKTDSQGGTGMAVAKLDLIAASDVLEMMHLPKAELLPIQLGIFGATGAVWGEDPYGGPTVPGVDWPEDKIWQSELGVSVFYSSVLLGRDQVVRISYAWPVGPGDRSNKLSFSYVQSLDFLRFMRHH